MDAAPLQGVSSRGRERACKQAAEGTSRVRILKSNAHVDVGSGGAKERARDGQLDLHAVLLGVRRAVHRRRAGCMHRKSRKE